MDLDDYLAALANEGDLFATAIATSGPDAAIPTCPTWVMRDLVHHQGEVHRWATAIVRDRLPKPSAVPEDFLGPLPSDDALGDWFVEGHAALLDTLRAADPAIECFTFLADPPAPIVFWARRQTQETGMHRVDAESPGADITPFSSAVAADGIDEMLAGFAPRKHVPLHSDAPTSMQIAPNDDDGRWHITISEAVPVTLRGVAEADCTVTGPASTIFMALWNRVGTDSLQIDGDAAVLDTFRDKVQVRWS